MTNQEIQNKVYRDVEPPIIDNVGTPMWEIIDKQFHHKVWKHVFDKAIIPINHQVKVRVRNHIESKLLNKSSEVVWKSLDDI